MHTYPALLVQFVGCVATKRDAAIQDAPKLADLRTCMQSRLLAMDAEKPAEDKSI